MVKRNDSRTDEAVQKREPYEAPAIVYREPLEAVAVACEPPGFAKGSPGACPQGPLSS